MKNLVVPFGLLFLASGYAARAECLEDAAKFSKNICGEIAQKGYSNFISGQGKLSIEGRDLVKKVLGDIGADISVEGIRSEWESVAQNELAGDRRDARGCSERMALAAMERVCQKPKVYRNCSNPAFGIASWGVVETVTGSSGWRGGGYNQEAYCNDLKNQAIAARQLGGKLFEIGPYQRNESQRMTWDRHAQYNYSCSFQLKSNPIYNSRRDPICGVE